MNKLLTLLVTLALIPAAVFAGEDMKHDEHMNKDHKHMDKEHMDKDHDHHDHHDHKDAK
jgi:Ni/Co efflux regulator RcnB